MKSNESDSGAKLRKPALKKVLNKKGQTPKHTARKVLNLAKLSNWPVRSSRLRRKNVVLLGHMEHRCPYCLELVKKNDPRGVVICPECKTWHHKDCWDITGTCQVAHRHDL